MKDYDYVKTNSVNHLYLIIDKLDGCIEEKNGNEYSTLISTDKNKEVLTKYTDLWDGIKNLIEKINDEPSEYGKDFMKVKFNTDVNLSLNNTVRIHNLTVTVRLFFKKTTNIIHKFF